MDKVKRLILSLVLLGLLSPLYAEESYQDLMRDFKRVYIQLLEAKVERIPAGTTVEVFLKDGTSVKGSLVGYYPYSDALWIHPLNARWGFLSDEAFDIRRVADVSIIVIREI
jgi:hypothetical protein